MSTPAIESGVNGKIVVEGERKELGGGGINCKYPLGLGKIVHSREFNS